MSLFQKLTTLFQAKEQSAAEAFDALVTTAADDDGKVDEKRAFEILTAAGKTASDFEAAVTLTRRRNAWQAEIDAADGVRPELSKLDAAFTKSTEQFEAEVVAPRSKYSSQQHDIDANRNRLNRIISTGELAARHLAETVPTDPALTARVAELRRQLAVAQGHGHVTGDADVRLCSNVAEEKRIASELTSIARQMTAASAA